MYGALYEFQLPADYLHLLNCVVNYKVKNNLNVMTKEIIGRLVQFDLLPIYGLKL